ncbi:hypothetical protein ACVWY0_003752 [Arthrobacter sp. UYNi723]
MTIRFSFMEKWREISGDLPAAAPRITDFRSFDREKLPGTPPEAVERTISFFVS